MTKPANQSIAFLERLSVELTASQMRSLCYVPALLIYYSFDLLGYRVEECMNHWIGKFNVDWLRLAIVEALYQGRYKVISIEQILILWQRRGQPICHFNHEFEQLVCSKLPEHLLPLEQISELIRVEVIPESSMEPQFEESSLAPAENYGKPDSLPTVIEEQKQSCSSATELSVEPSVEPSVDSIISESKTRLSLDLPSPKVSDQSSSGELDGARSETQPPINQFSPPLPPSEFYLKLKALASEEENENKG